MRVRVFFDSRPSVNPLAYSRTRCDKSLLRDWSRSEISTNRRSAMCRSRTGNPRSHRRSGRTFAGLALPLDWALEEIDGGREREACIIHCPMWACLTHTHTHAAWTACTFSCTHRVWYHVIHTEHPSNGFVASRGVIAAAAASVSCIHSD